MNPFVPPGHVRFSEAVEIVAQHRFQHELVLPLTRDEQEVMSDDSELRLEAERNGSDWNDDDPRDAPALVDLRRRSGLRYRQVSQATDELRQALWDANVVARVITDAGTLHEVVKHHWYSRDFSTIQKTGMATITDGSGSQSGRVLILRSELERYLNDMEVGEAQPIRFVEPDTLSPYLQFMIKAHQALELSDGKRRTKEKITHWLKENWPECLGESSNNKINYMATFLRRPDHEKGGYVV